ncbi:MAG: gamma subclass chorismate mutase AroQ [Oceanicoccus sp.]
MNLLPRLLRLPLIILCLIQSNAVLSTEIDPSITTLFQLIQQRLSHMDDVAKYKWHHKLNIEDQTRESQVLEKSAAAATRFNLDGSTSRDFFTLQIEAAKEIQTGWFQQWHRSTAPEQGADLVNTVRPKLISLGDQILRQIELSYNNLQQANPAHLKTRFLHIVNVDHLSQQTALTLLSALKNIRLSSHHNRLQTILVAGEIRIGTTGDYAPFSWLDKKTGSYTGIDIDLARDLAESLNVDLVFVPTSWPTLASDFKHQKFDIAMSGVSINLQRQQLGFFSQAYHRGGKTPISRCADKSKYNSLEKINQPTTRVIVNPGGTNFKFAEKNLTQANLRVFDNNQTIFKEITEERADVMITDAIEVMLQSNQSNLLCATMPEKTLSISEKGFWIQPDVHLKEYVNQWLHQRKIEGIVKKLIDHHLNN